MKKRPTWATVVGVLGIIFACFGILGAGYDIMMPKMMDLQKEIFSHIEEIQTKAAGKGDSESFPDDDFFEIFQSMEKMWETPEWFGTWSIITGITKLVICGFALFASICLLQIKPFSIRLFYWSAGLNIGLILVNLVVMMASMSFMAIAMMSGGFFGLVVYVVLIIVVALGNKEAFFQTISPTVSS